MLVLSRNKDESVIINDDITVKVVDIRGDKVKLGFEAPIEIPIHREEVHAAINRFTKGGTVQSGYGKDPKANIVEKFVDYLRSAMPMTDEGIVLQVSRDWGFEQRSVSESNSQNGWLWIIRSYFNGGPPIQFVSCTPLDQIMGTPFTVSITNSKVFEIKVDSQF